MKIRTTGKSVVGLGGAIAGKKEATRHFAYDQSPESVDHVIADAAAPTAAI